VKIERAVRHECVEDNPERPRHAGDGFTNRCLRRYSTTLWNVDGEPAQDLVSEGGVMSAPAVALVRDGRYGAAVLCAGDEVERVCTFQPATLLNTPALRRRETAPDTHPFERIHG